MIKKIIDGYPIIKEYKYLGIIINDKIMNIQKHIGNIEKKLDEHFKQNYNLNKNISVKSILLIFGYFHKSRLL